LFGLKISGGHTEITISVCVINLPCQPFWTPLNQLGPQWTWSRTEVGSFYDEEHCIRDISWALLLCRPYSEHSGAHKLKFFLSIFLFESFEGIGVFIIIISVFITYKWYNYWDKSMSYQSRLLHTQFTGAEQQKYYTSKYKT